MGPGDRVCAVQDPWSWDGMRPSPVHEVLGEGEARRGTIERVSDDGERLLVRWDAGFRGFPETFGWWGKELLEPVEGD